MCESDLPDEYEPGDVRYVRFEMSDSVLEAMVWQDWQSYGFECVVIDLKLFQADADTLLDIFAAQKSAGLKTVLVTSDLSDNFTHTNFMSYVDKHYPSDFSRLRTFIRDTLGHFQGEIDSNTGVWQNVNIVIDGYLIDADVQTNIHNMAQTSVFLRILLEEFLILFENLMNS